MCNATARRHSPVVNYASAVCHPGREVYRRTGGSRRSKPRLTLGPVPSGATPKQSSVCSWPTCPGCTRQTPSISARPVRLKSPSACAEAAIDQQLASSLGLHCVAQGCAPSYSLPTPGLSSATRMPLRRTPCRQRKGHSSKYLPPAVMCCQPCCPAEPSFVNWTRGDAVEPRVRHP